MVSHFSLSYVFPACILLVSHAGLRGVTAAGVEAAVSPEVEDSDKKFFGKEYPWDKRPKVDAFHFKHPYPVVQDSNDFDKDFVKDENSDNGEWKAQSEYDRLRHKLSKEKAQVAKAVKAKESAEEALREATMKAKEAKKRAEENVKIKAAEAEKARQKEEAAKAKEAKEKAEAEARAKASAKEGPGKPVSPFEAAPIAGPGDVERAVGDVKRAMDALDMCKKQLADARENLKKVMKDLEVAKKSQDETRGDLGSAKDLEEKYGLSQKSLEKTTKDEYQQYLDAREAYLKTQADIAKWEVDIKVAEAKVRSFRDAADQDGGVYNHPPSAAVPSTMPLFMGMLLLAMCSFVDV